MTIYQMEAFSMLCQTLNYTRASEVLHTTQPNLSKIIVNIEQELGVQLLVRNKRDVKLTPAGEVFYKDLQKLLKDYYDAVQHTKEVYDGVTGVLDIGFLGTALINRLPKIVNQFHVEYPKTLLNLKDYTYSPLVQALVEDAVDVAFLPDKELDHIRGLEKKQLIADDMCVAVSNSHPLAKESCIELRVLAKESFVMMDPIVSQRDVDLVNNICMDANFEPITVYQANTLANLLMMIECNIGVSILADHMKHFASNNVSFIPISGYENYFRMVCAWRKKANPNVFKLLDIIDKISIE